MKYFKYNEAFLDPDVTPIVYIKDDNGYIYNRYPNESKWMLIDEHTTLQNIKWDKLVEITKEEAFRMLL